jgi:HAD superfamily hydrolase (TIGR01662 family)
MKEFNYQTVEEAAAFFDTEEGQLHVLLRGMCARLPESRRDYLTHPDLVIIFDRDGILNINTHYPFRLDDLYIPSTVTSAMELITAYRRFKKIECYVATNQLGIEKDYYTFEDYYRFNDLLCFMLTKDHQAPPLTLHNFYGAFKSEHAKPNPYLFNRIIQEHKLEKDKIVAIGDQDRDTEAAKAAGIERVYKSSAMTLDTDLKSILFEYFKETPGGPTS